MNDVYVKSSRELPDGVERFESELRTENYVVRVYPSDDGRIPKELKPDRLWISHKSGEGMEISINKLWEDF